MTVFVAWFNFGIFGWITWSNLMILSFRRWRSQGQGETSALGAAFWRFKLRLESHVIIMGVGNGAGVQGPLDFKFSHFSIIFSAKKVVSLVSRGKWNFITFFPSGKFLRLPVEIVPLKKSFRRPWYEMSNVSGC